jgi:hypothetical protein
MANKILSIYRPLALLKGFTFFVLLYSCDPSDNRLKIINKSNSDVYAYISCDSLLTDFKLFRNGYYKNNVGDSTYVISDEFIKRDTFMNIPKFGRNAWERYVEDCPNRRLNLYVFDDTIIHTHTDAEISFLKLYRHHIGMTHSELEESNWTITLE